MSNTHSSFCKLGGFNFSLGDIRHGILRCNRKPPANFWGRQLEGSDPRIQFRLHIRDPRSLLVLIDSCAPIPPPSQSPVLKPGRTDTDLEHYAEQYCSNYVAVDECAHELRLPKLFRVYVEDFGSSEAEMIGWLAQYIRKAPSDILRYRVRYAHGILV